MSKTIDETTTPESDEAPLADILAALMEREKAKGTPKDEVIDALDDAGEMVENDEDWPLLPPEPEAA